MVHIRAQLREKVANVLTSAGLSVFTNRTHVIQPAELPCAVITTDSDITERYNAIGFLNREIKLVIRLYERAFANVDDDLDTLCVTVENALSKDSSITANAIDLNMTTIDIADGDQQIGVATMVYSVKVLSVKDPEQII